MTIVVFGSSSVMLLWALCYPLIVLSLPYAPVMQTAFLRALLGGVFLLLCAVILRRPFPRCLSAWFAIFTIGITATTVGFWGMFYAGSLISPGLATVLTNTQPLIASAIAAIALKEELNQSMRISIFLGFVGILVIGVDGLLGINFTALQGILYVFSAAISIAISNIILKKTANKIDVFYAMGGQLLIGSLPLYWLASPLDIKLLFEEDFSYYLILMGLAIPGTAMPFLLWYWLMDKAPLSQLNIFSFLTPIFGLFLAWVYFAESLSIWQWIGVIVVVIAILISILPNRPNQRLPR